MHYVSNLYHTKKKKKWKDKYDYCTSNVLKGKKGILTYYFVILQIKAHSVVHSRLPVIKCSRPIYFRLQELIII